MSTPKREKKQIVTLPTTRISSIMKSAPDVSSVSADSVLVAARAAVSMNVFHVNSPF